MLRFTLVCLNLMVVWDGLRPNVGFEMVGHITLPPSPFFLIPKVRPPSAQ